MNMTECKERMQKDMEGLVIVPSENGGVKTTGRILVINHKRIATVRDGSGTVAMVPISWLTPYSTLQRG